MTITLASVQRDGTFQTQHNGSNDYERLPQVLMFALSIHR